MASKSKGARHAAAKAKTKSAWPVILWSLAAAFTETYNSTIKRQHFNHLG